MTERSNYAALAGAALLATCLATGDTFAQGANPSLVGQYGDWGVYVSQGQKAKVCFALTQPKERLPANLNRDPGYLFVSTRPADNVRNEFSVLIGFPLKEDADPSLTVGNDTFALYARQTGAWIRNVAEEARLIEALRKGKDLTMKSTSVRGNVTTDRYSLSGIAQALDRVAQECR
ncbi:MAG TPA: invasion associated locus B family protein [Xanthobacteraceae bacterium]|jgi:invasion protein IalB